MARTGISKWIVNNNTYITPDGSYDILLNGSNHYFNFGTLTGPSGYGIRDNAGVIEVKSSAEDWSKAVGITISATAPPTPYLNQLWFDLS